VEASEIDPIYYQRSYYLAPSDDPAKKPYALLVKAMAQSERIGVATFVMRGKQYLAAIRPSADEKVLVLETMHFADEVRDPARELDGLPQRTKVEKKDLDMAVSLVTSLTTKWNPKNYRDTYTERVETLIDAKKRDREIVVPQRDEESAGKVVDLLATLQASVDAARGHKPGNTRDLPKLDTRKADEKSDSDDRSAKRTSTKKTATKKGTRKAPAKKGAAKKAAAKKAAAKKRSSSGSGSTRKAS
jgi:DNA end-binding protein Ku